MAGQTQTTTFSTSHSFSPYETCHKVKLEIELKAGWPISEADQDWLDGDGNLVSEERVVEALDNASESDYEQGLERLSSQEKLIVEKLQKLAGKVRKDYVPSKKRKCTFFRIFAC